MEWWGWIVFGLLLLGGEVFTAGLFYLLFFGFGAILVGLLGLFNLGLSSSIQWLFFSVISVVLVLLFRKHLVGLNMPHMAGTDRDKLEGEIAISVDRLSAGEMGKAEMRGSTWNAKNVGSEPIHSGDRCKIVKVNGLILELVKGENK